MPNQPMTAPTPILITRDEAALIVKLVRDGFSVDGSDDPPADALATALAARLKAPS